MTKELKYKVGDKVLVKSVIKKVHSVDDAIPYSIKLESGLIALANIEDIVDQPQKVKIPQFVADYIEKCKGDGYSLRMSLYSKNIPDNLYLWFSYCINQELFARAWIDGYEVEKEKKYIVKIEKTNQILFKRHTGELAFILDVGNRLLDGEIHFTKQELIDAGFGGVFDNPMFEVMEVE